MVEREMREVGGWMGVKGRESEGGGQSTLKRGAGRWKGAIGE